MYLTVQSVALHYIIQFVILTISGVNVFQNDSHVFVPVKPRMLMEHSHAVKHLMNDDASAVIVDTTDDINDYLNYF